MSIRKRTPQKCDQQRISFETSTWREVVEKSVPDKTSEAYSLTLNRFNGSFGSVGSKSYYSAVQGGEWLVVEQEVVKTSQLGTFACRRSQNEGLSPVVAEGKDRVLLAQGIYDTVKGLGWCGTCPYFKMDSTEADRYDARAKNAQAENLVASLALEQAKAELDDFMAHKSGENASAIMGELRVQALPPPDLCPQL